MNKSQYKSYVQSKVAVTNPTYRARIIKVGGARQGNEAKLETFLIQIKRQDFSELYSKLWQNPATTFEVNTDFIVKDNYELEPSSLIYIIVEYKIANQASQVKNMQFTISNQGILPSQGGATETVEIGQKVNTSTSWNLEYFIEFEFYRYPDPVPPIPPIPPVVDEPEDEGDFEILIGRFGSIIERGDYQFYQRFSGRR